MLYEQYDALGKNNIKATRSDFIDSIGEEGIKDLLRSVLTGGNVRDTTEFITQRRLLSSYASMCELYIHCLKDEAGQAEPFVRKITEEMACAKGDGQKLFYFWMFGLTKKGFDNIVRSQEHFQDYRESFLASLQETEEDIAEHFGTLSGTICLNGAEMPLDWNFLLLLSLCMGAQTLSIRGSSKSMVGKLFEKLLLGTLLSVLGFSYLDGPPSGAIAPEEKLFWLSNMDENERETDATLIYGGKAISIDIGFIGKGNPEISLDKVSRFNRYKQISGVEHQMNTIIIVDTVAEHSDLLNKAKRIQGAVFQMIHPDWTVCFAREVCSIFHLDHPLCRKRADELDDFFRNELRKISVKQFLE